SFVICFALFNKSFIQKPPYIKFLFFHHTLIIIFRQGFCVVLYFYSLIALSLLLWYPSNISPISFSPEVFKILSCKLNISCMFSLNSITLYQLIIVTFFCFSILFKYFAIFLFILSMYCLFPLIIIISSFILSSNFR